MIYYDDINAYNRFVNLDSIEERIIFFILSKEGKNPEQQKLVDNIWRLLYYPDMKCLVNDTNHPNVTFKQIYDLIDNEDPRQNNKRVFRSPFIEEAIVEDGAMLRIYLDSLLPKNTLLCQANIAIEIITHNRSSNISNPLYDENDNIINPTEEYPLIRYKSRSTTLLKNILALLNGANVASVGTLQFNQGFNRFVNSKMGIWNNRNFFGQKLVMSCEISGVS